MPQFRGGDKAIRAATVRERPESQLASQRLDRSLSVAALILSVLGTVGKSGTDGMLSPWGVNLFLALCVSWLGLPASSLPTRRIMLRNAANLTPIPNHPILCFQSIGGFCSQKSFSLLDRQGGLIMDQ